MDADVETFLARIGQPDFSYVNFNTLTDVEVAERFPLIAELVHRLGCAGADAPGPGRAS